MASVWCKRRIWHLPGKAAVARFNDLGPNKHSDLATFSTFDAHFLHL
jgi:hypothetical protein